jgi:hypothetical protein
VDDLINSTEKFKISFWDSVGFPKLTTRIITGKGAVQNLIEEKGGRPVPELWRGFYKFSHRLLGLQVLEGTCGTFFELSLILRI